ncbi:Rab11 family-interacting protein 3/4, partial [Paragonimus westermani]
TRTTRDYTNQMETLRTRIHTLETECSELRVECARVKADHQASSLDRRRNSEALQDAQDQLRNLQQQMSSLEAKHSQELQILRQDRDHAVHVLEELNGSMSERRRSRIGSQSPFSGSIAGGSEVIARYQESQEIVRRLITENKSLRQQLEDAQDQLFARSLEEGRSLVGPTERSWAAEIDNCTKEEVIELYTKEKHFNEQLRKYIDSLITRIIERHPSLLEIASSAGK